MDSIVTVSRLKLYKSKCTTNLRVGDFLKPQWSECMHVQFIRRQLEK